MKNYEIKTGIRGLRVKGLDRREPAPVGEVIALHPSAIGRLVEIGALEETDRSATIEADDAMSASAEALLRTSDFIARANDAPISVVAVTDRHALASAIEELGGLVFFPGEGLPDDAEQILQDFSNPQLLDELTVRLAEGRLLPTEIPSALLPPAPIAAAEVSGDGSGEALPPVDQPPPSDLKPVVAEQEAAPKAAPRKKAAAK